jgi:hypothetical protein
MNKSYIFCELVKKEKDTSPRPVFTKKPDLTASLRYTIGDADAYWSAFPTTRHRVHPDQSNDNHRQWYVRGSSQTTSLSEVHPDHPRKNDEARYHDGLEPMDMTPLPRLMDLDSTDGYRYAAQTTRSSEATNRQTNRNRSRRQPAPKLAKS